MDNTKSKFLPLNVVALYMCYCACVCLCACNSVNFVT